MLWLWKQSVFHIVTDGTCAWGCNRLLLTEKISQPLPKDFPFLSLFRNLQAACVCFSCILWLEWCYCVTIICTDLLVVLCHNSTKLQHNHRNLYDCYTSNKNARSRWTENSSLWKTGMSVLLYCCIVLYCSSNTNFCICLDLLGHVPESRLKKLWSLKLKILLC